MLGTPHHPPGIAQNSPQPGDMVLGFKPSEYQKAIFDWLATGEGSCVVNAVPGSGKTTTLIKGIHYIPKSLRSHFLAFNKHIAAELSLRLPKHIGASTIHSLGLSSLCRRFRGRPEINKRKYSEIVSRYLSDRNVYTPQRRQQLIEFIKFTQLTLTDPRDLPALKQLSHHYGLSSLEDWDFLQKAILEILETGIRLSRACISYEDMIWLPIALNIPIQNYDFLCVDEAQDLNKAQLEIVLKACRSGARGIYVGDRNQAIMGFAASDCHSITQIVERTNALELPLSICYRCPTSHIELAAEIYSGIQPRADAPIGTVSHISISELPQRVKGEDLIICRCFYPLVPIYFDLLKQGIPAKVQNQDLDIQLISLLKQIIGESERSLSASTFTNLLNIWYERQKQEMEQDNANVMAIVNLHDRILTLNAIYAGSNCQTTGDLKAAIANLCQDPKNAVVLTTIHGAKGLEANRVFHVRPNLVPHYRAEKDWEKEQERNLQFVSLTRAKQELFFVR